MGQILSLLPFEAMTESSALPVLNLNYPQDVTIVESASSNATFIVNISEHGKPADYTYQWYFNNIAVDGANSSNFILLDSISVGSYNVYCEVSNRAGTVTSRIATLTVESCLPIYTYTGTHNLIEEGNYNWKIKFLSSGTLTFTKLNNSSIDVFLVGGGGGGTRYYGYGGGGGETETFSSTVLQENIPYEIIIGAGGAKGNSSGEAASNGGNTVFNNTLIALGGKGSDKGGAGGGGDGGSGGSGSTSGLGGVDGTNGTGGSNPGTGQGSTTRAFGESDGELYSTGGNGKSNTTGEDGRPNTGDGGCGGDGSVVNYSGGSGIAIIRNTR